MSDPALPPLQPVRKFTGGQIAMIVVGVILLLPGGCALLFMFGMLADFAQRRHSDPYLELFVMVWLVCFAISALGIVLIVVARRRAWRSVP